MLTNMYTFVSTSTKAIAAAGLLLGTVSAAQGATELARWDFDVADVADIGTDIVSATDSVNSLVGTQHPSNAVDVTYGNGTTADPLDGSADFTGGNGLLEVSDPTGILTGHNGGGLGLTSLQIDVDVDMAADGGTWVIARNGHGSGDPGMSFNLFVQSGGKIGLEMRGTSLVTAIASGVLDANAGWQHITATWDGVSISLALDGSLVTLNSGGTTLAADIGPLHLTDANMGIGGLRRAGDPGSIGQFLNGSIDNLVISTDVPEPASLMLASIGAAVVTVRGRWR